MAMPTLATKVPRSSPYTPHPKQQQKQLRRYLTLKAVTIPALLLLLTSSVLAVKSLLPGPYADGTASYSLATSALAARGSACGYGNQYTDGFGDFRASASPLLFSGGSLCGACFQIMCASERDPVHCKKGSTLNVTVTDQCMPSAFSGPSDPCDAKAKHFVLPPQIYSLIAKQSPTAKLPIHYRRVACQRQGGIVFQLNGSPQMIQVNIRNVGGPGTIGMVWIQAGRSTQWTAMQRSFGENWMVAGNFLGKTLSFKLFSPDTSQTVIAPGVVPSTWVFGGKYSKSQF